MKKSISIMIIVVSLIAIGISGYVFFMSNKKITISFNTNSEINLSNIEIKKGEKISLPTLDRDGYVFLGWYLDGKEIDSSYTFDGNSIINAKWEKENDCPLIDGGTVKIVKFNTNGGDIIEDMNICVTCSPEDIILPTPTRKYYTFLGWYDDANFMIKVEESLNDIKNAHYRISHSLSLKSIHHVCNHLLPKYMACQNS